MIDPVFFLGLSILLVAVSLTAVLVAAVPAFQELGRAARSVEKLADTLSRELPPTLEAIRLTGLEISDLTDDVSEGVKSASGIVKQVDQGVEGAKRQAQKAQVTTRSVFAGVKAAWSSLTRSPNHSRRNSGRLPASPRPSVELDYPSDRSDYLPTANNSGKRRREFEESDRLTARPEAWEEFEPEILSEDEEEV